MGYPMFIQSRERLDSKFGILEHLLSPLALDRISRGEDRMSRRLGVLSLQHQNLQSLLNHFLGIWQLPPLRHQ